MKVGWEVKPLENVTTKIGSGATPKGGKSAYKQTGIALIRSMNVHDLEFRTKDLARIDEEQAAKLSIVEVQKGDVLLNITGASIARCSVVPESALPARVNQHVAIIRPVQDEIDAEYLAYLLVSKDHKDALLGIGGDAGSTRQALTKSHIQNYRIPIPPLEEQKRIVAVLAVAFEGLTRAKENAEANLQYTRELFESSLERLLEAAETGIEAITLGEVCDFVGGSQPPKSKFLPKPAPDAIRLIQIRDYKSDNKAVYIPKALARRFCATDDVMIGRYGPPLFQILRGLEGAYNVALMKAVPDASLLTKEYLFYFLRNRKILRYIIDASDRAAGQIGINKKTIEPYPINVPSFEIQTETVSKMRNIEAEVERLSAEYTAKLTDIADLRQSLLQKAFAGELS